MTSRFIRQALTLAAVLLLPTAGAMGQGMTVVPPTSAERPQLIEKVRATYPTMPEHLVATFADWRLQLADNSPCELVDWIAAQPPQTAPPGLRLPNTCAFGIGDLTPDAARELLAGKPLAASIDGDVVTVVVQSSDPVVRLCCSIQGPAERIGDSDLWAARLRLPEAERAMLFLANTSDRTAQPLFVRGPLAPAQPKLAPFPRQGQLLSREFTSEALGETRRLHIYLPPGWSKERRWPALFMADAGAQVYASVIEQMILDGTIPPTVIVSAESGQVTAEGDMRGLEYVKGRARFDRHMRFFAEELVRYAREEFAISTDPEQVAVAGASNGGVFALWAGLLRPEVFGDAIAMSPGIVEIAPGDLTGEPRARFHVSGGLYETGFNRAAHAAEDALRQAGFEVTARYPAAGHAQDQWMVVLHDALRQMHAGD